ncbi:MAG: dihydroxy-acid dehydratase [Hyphomicrobiales bacterium]|nr:dihydroxy-acid dehydratase [Hyphomicrobiales bacterium]MDE2114948.1 dihydroxy-acid dehydratase [Hyphomicrobiales bacterium]
MTKKIEELRSQRWYAGTDTRGFTHRQRSQQIGLRREEFMGKPVIAIINTWSDLSPCHSHLRDRAEAVKRGVWQAGGYPVELPAMSLGEVMVKPSTMLYRNFLAMEAEELLRSLPIDGAVLLGGCDKTTPGLLMGAISMDLPAIYCPAGPMSNGRWHNERVGAGTHTKKFWNEKQAGNVSETEWVELEAVMTRSIGTCNTMGTASTMTSIVDALGMCLPGASSIPAADSGHVRMASACGVRAVAMVWEDLKPSKIINAQSVHNAAVACMALGGSTNAAIHLIAIARRAGVDLSLDDMAAVADKVPLCANLFPAGTYLMEDFFFAGGLMAQLGKLGAFLHPQCITVNGKTLGENIAKVQCQNDDVIRAPEAAVVPLSRGVTLAVMRGNLCPDGAIMRTSVADPALLQHEGRAWVFESPADVVARIENPEIAAGDVLVLRNGGPVGAPGMPEWGNLPIPKHLLQQGVRDMVRISDCRMSGTHYGTCVLHVAPEAAIGGPLALLVEGDRVRLDVPGRRLDMLVPEAEIARRRALWVAPPDLYPRSYAKLYREHVGQAPDGCDFDFLERGGSVPEPEIF